MAERMGSGHAWVSFSGTSLLNCNETTELFVPIFTVDETAVCWVLQKMSDLNASTVDKEIKQEELQKLSDQISSKMVGKEGTAVTTAKMTLCST